MIEGIGIDAVKISRMEKWADNPPLLGRFFNPREIAAARERGSGMSGSLAARFAAKEAFAKALGTGLAGIVLKDIMILNGRNEKPELILEGSALAAMKTFGARRAHLSLTHEGDTAIALVILEA
ncbi:MAG: holo-ACP synthase [Spirochaetaceae bacterium]|jgi:holo-[acyl-carrier protein] synthase|nr:holo-ACP synthase [Spirochaetaceae bacterium]